MKLEKASHKAIVFACMNFHYAKAVPVNVSGYSVFNDNKEWCGVALFGSGTARNLAKPYGLVQGEVKEFVRMALNGKQEQTSKVLSTALKLFKKDNPLCRLIISYSDTNQNHFGTIYQASNWYYTGQTPNNRLITIDGVLMHPRSAGSKYGSYKLDYLKNKGHKAEYIDIKPKHKYIYPLDKSLVPMCQKLAKPYPKKLAAVAQLERTISDSEMAYKIDPVAPYKTV